MLLYWELGQVSREDTTVIDVRNNQVGRTGNLLETFIYHLYD